MKKINISLLIGFILTLIISNISIFAKNYDNLKDSVVRLHILANSDSEEDQHLKLQVRDAILQKSENLFNNSDSVTQTEKIIEDNMQELLDTAHNVISSNGYNYNVKCELTNMYFEERVYDNFTLPAGKYDTFRISIGEAKGHNWWCVMYPPLCLPAAMEDKKLEDVFTKEELLMIKNPQKYQVKFKVVEIYEKLMNKKKTLKINKENVTCEKITDSQMN